MDNATVIGILGVISTVAAIGVTVTLFILKGMKDDSKTQWTQADANSKEIWKQCHLTQKELSDFKEHIALHYPNEGRVNEKMEATHQRFESSLGLIDKRLHKLESESSQIIQILKEQQQSQPALLAALQNLENLKRTSQSG